MLAIKRQLEDFDGAVAAQEPCIRAISDPAIKAQAVKIHNALTDVSSSLVGCFNDELIKFKASGGGSHGTAITCRITDGTGLLVQGAASAPNSTVGHLSALLVAVTGLNSQFNQAHQTALAAQALQLESIPQVPTANNGARAGQSVAASQSLLAVGALQQAQTSRTNSNGSTGSSSNYVQPQQAPSIAAVPMARAITPATQLAGLGSTPQRALPAAAAQGPGPLPSGCIDSSTGFEVNSTFVTVMNHCNEMLHVNICAVFAGDIGSRRLANQVSAKNSTQFSFFNSEQVAFNYQLQYCRPGPTVALNNCEAMCPQSP